MPSFIIKNIPEETMRLFKTACASLQITMREVLLNYMATIIKGYQEYGVLEDGKPKTIKKKG